MANALTEPSSRRLRRAQAAVIATFFVHGFVFASWTAHIPHVKARLGIGDSTLGLALLGAPVGSVSAMALAAYLIPRLGSRRMVQICVTGYCLSGPLVGLAGSVAQLFGALFVWGLFQGTLDISMNTQAIAVERRKGRPLMNGMHACWGIGAFTGAGAGTLGVALGASLAWQLLLFGVVSLVVAGWLSFGMLLDAAEPEPAAEVGLDPVRAPRRWLGRISGAMLLLGAIAFASMLCEGAAADWSSVYLRDSLGGSAPGLGYTCFTLALVGVRLFGNRLLARYSARVLLPALAGLATVGFGSALLIGDVVAATVAFFLLGAGVGAVIPTAFSAAGRLPGMHPGVGVAAVSGLGWAGFVFGPPIIGQLAGLASLPWALALVPVLTAFVAVATRRVSAMHAPHGAPAAADTVPGCPA